MWESGSSSSSPRCFTSPGCRCFNSFFQNFTVTPYRSYSGWPSMQVSMKRSKTIATVPERFIWIRFLVFYTGRWNITSSTTCPPMSLRTIYPNFIRCFKIRCRQQKRDCGKRIVRLLLQWSGRQKIQITRFLWVFPKPEPWNWIPLKGVF